MAENLNQQNWGGINNNKPMPPLPPPPEITLRTMQSDINSVKQSGGSNAVPKPFTPPEVKKQPTTMVNDMPGEEGMITTNPGEGAVPPSQRPKNKSKAVILIIILLLVVAGLAYAGYTYIYPLFIKTTVPVATTPETSNQTPVATPPVSLGTTTEETIPAGTTPTTTSITPVPVLLSHLSFLTAAPDSTASLTIASPISLTLIKQALSAEAVKKPLTEIAFKETVLSGDQGQLAFSETFPIFFPEFNASELSPLFESDFTAVLYYDKNGVWPGIIAKAAQGSDINAVKALIASKLEQSAGLVNLYLQDPGAKSGTTFKDGSASGQLTRYISFAKTGASFNYAWVKNNMLVISSSYNGLKAIFAKMGIQ